MIKCIVVDDVQAVRQTTKSMIRDYCSDLLEVVGEAYDMDSAIKEIKRLDPQLVFMDIKFEYTDGKEGFDVLKYFGQTIPFEVIFITDYSRNADYLIQCIEVAAVGFVPKPIDKELLLKYVLRAKGRIDMNDIGKSPQVLVENKNKQQHSQEQEMGINSIGGTLKKARIADILYLEADEKLVKVITIAKDFHTDRTLKRFGEILKDYGFFRIHHGHLINIKHVKEYNSREKTVLMSNGKVLLIAKRRIDDFEKAMENNIL
jgi:two-component system, LytTR family, response regulator